MYIYATGIIFSISILYSIVNKTIHGNPVMFVSSMASNLNVLLPKNGFKYAFTLSVSPTET
jgi:hypothetical protein